mmetsp:Transcript_23257/g.36365  ORF Transcript_23257/g.36365 Transcript_23257/m.36365 type:complete len:121 (-) Transcript_23257:1855-2217(-)
MPLSKTMITSDCLAVLSRCAIIKVVLPLQIADVCGVKIFLCIFFSVVESKFEVASSKRISFGFLMMQRARPTRCLSPPLNFIPLSPTIVSSFSGNEFANLSNAESRTASQICSSVASSLP